MQDKIKWTGERGKKKNVTVSNKMNWDFGTKQIMVAVQLFETQEY